MEHCQVNSSFWQVCSTETLALISTSDQASSSLLENLTDATNATNDSWNNISSIPLFSVALIAIGAIEIFQQMLQKNSPFEKSKNEKISFSPPIRLYFLIITQLLLATVLPTIRFIPNYSSSGYLMRSFVQFLFWTVTILLSRKDRQASESEIDKWNWNWWRTPLFYLINSLERLFLVCYSPSGFTQMLFGFESLLTIVVIGLEFKIKQEKSSEEEDAEKPTDDSEENVDSKPPRSLFVKLRLLLPYLWPKSEWSLQMRVAACFGILVLGRITTVYVPLINKQIVDSLTRSPSGVRNFRWDLIVLHAVLFFVEHSLFDTSRNILWQSIEQFASREAQVKLYEHLLNLSLRFHIGRKTGEVIKVMDRGTSNITQILNYSLFEIVPIFADIIIGAVFLTTTFDLRFTLIAINTIVLYSATIMLTYSWKNSMRKEMNKTDDAFRAIAVDSLLNYETVKYYNAEDFESNRYREALVKSQKNDWLWNATVECIDSLEKVIIRGGLLAGSLLCAYLISRDEDGLTIGDYVLFATYMQQLINPLRYLQHVFRWIQKASVDMEKMFDIMEEQPEVGPSGAGKSTIIRLLFRFYDVNSGQVLFDDQDVITVKQKSLRRYMGVVPQDTVLFNDSIRFNIRYGRVDASDDEVEAAAKAADIHDSILGFSEQYDTKVGERGLKLSGGEKQRVAIARTILKAPTFVFLDEATSALDTNTERNIQASLQKVCTGRTTVVIAHRLSTVIGADEIIVLQKGAIAERGTHSDLLEQKGLYHDMWMQQLSPEKNEIADLTDAPTN